MVEEILNTIFSLTNKKQTSSKKGENETQNIQTLF